LLIVGLIFVDLTPFQWNSVNITDLDKGRIHHLNELISCAPPVRFLKSQPGVFRVNIDMPVPPNIGDAYDVNTTSGAGATVLYTYLRTNGMPDLYNAQYRMVPASSADPNPLYSDAYWKIYRDSSAFPHAWLVHRVTVEHDRDKTLDNVIGRVIDLHNVAFVPKPLDPALDASSGQPEDASITNYGTDSMGLKVQSHGRALLVLSENYFPGWKASVNGRPAPIYRVDGALRGIVVPDGTSVVKVWYASWSVRLGLLISFLAFLAVGVAYYFDRRSQSVPYSGPEFTRV
jgi:hypothetical protein